MYTNDSARDGSSTGVRMRRFDADLNPLGRAVLVNTYTHDDQNDPYVTVY